MWRPSGSAPSTSRSMAVRSSTVNHVCFAELSSTATMRRSNRRDARAIISTWPLVSGSNEPGHTATRTKPPRSGRGAPKPLNHRISVRTRPVERQGAVAGLKNPAAHEWAGVFRRRTPLAVLEHQHTSRTYPPGCHRDCQLDVPGIVGRVEENELKRPGGDSPLFERGEISGNDVTRGRCTAGVDVLANHRQRTPVVLDERHLRRTPAERFKADGAGACKPIEDARAVDLTSQHVEERFAQPVGRRPNPGRGRALERSPLQ